jgi:hypothetical protein
MRLSRQVSLAVLWRDLRLLSGFLAVNLAEIKVKVVGILFVPQQVTEIKTL